MKTIHQPRPGSGVGIVSVSASLEALQRMRRLGISASEAFRRGLFFFFNEIEGKETDDALYQKIEKMVARIEEQTRTIDEQARQIEILREFSKGGKKP